MMPRREKRLDSKAVVKRHRVRIFSLVLILAIAQTIMLGIAILTIRAVEVGRAYVAAETQYSKAQKSAIINLGFYLFSGRAERFLEFQRHLSIPLGDRIAREALSQPVPNFEAARAGFLQARNSSGDVPDMSEAFLLFKSLGPIAEAIDEWHDGDQLISRLVQIGQEAHLAFLRGNANQETLNRLMVELGQIDKGLTDAESGFSEHIKKAETEIRNMAICALIAVALLTTLIGFVLARLILGYTDHAELTLFRSHQEASRARDDAECANRAKSAFLASMSHELRTPLNAIIGFSEMIKCEMLGAIMNRRYVEYGADIHRAGVHLLAIINDILDLSRIEASKLVLDKEKIDVESLVESAVMLCADKARENNVDIIVQTEPLATGLYADKLRLSQAIINLLSNAVKFTPSGGTIWIRTYADPDGFLAISVKDSGIGMTPQEIEIAVTPFMQVDNGWNKKLDGTGLGLSITKRLMELHEGTLEILSAPDQGTEVLLRLPIGKRQSTAADTDSRPELCEAS